MLSSKVRAIIRREYLQRVRSKWFLFSTLFVPVLLLASTLLPAFLIDADDGGDRPIALISSGGADLDNRIIAAARHDSLRLVRLPGAADGMDKEMVATMSRDSGFRGYLLIPPDILETGRATLLEDDGLRRVDEERLESALYEAIVATRLERAGIEDAELGREVDLAVEELGAGEGASDEVYQVLGFGFALTLYMMFIVYGQMIARGVLEEKTSDIVEIMVSSVRPREMMMGKILGVGAVGLTQVAIWGVLITGFSLYGIAGAAPALAEMGIDLSEFEFPWFLTMMALIYFVLGYLFYAGMFASAGAMLGNDQDVQQVMLPVILPIVIPIMVLPAVVESPDATWAVILSLIPYFSPILMTVRIAVGHAATWQVVLSVVLLVVSVGIVARVAGRIYRLGILMKGKRPNLPELIRWVRYG